MSELGLRFIALLMAVVSGVVTGPIAFLSWFHVLSNVRNHPEVRTPRGLLSFTVAIALVPAGFIALYLPDMPHDELQGFRLIGTAHVCYALLIAGSTVLSVLAVVRAVRDRVRGNRPVMYGAILLVCIDALHVATIIASANADGWTHWI
jgi:Co/Zn/Cd efflux system component